ncbi:tetraacyldisaccharide 4'-kinase [Bibersteinia trehalosi Y31]|uniref:Tetraacyldisaccharide 4'-kinase n=1 Tax=Bibersteinia trehalosi Y31 TaxID=1261658 RepID=A0A179CYD9_BIBTR|nr:tetraacyldisaccharide 4'-kinase [Bibersteinia trehalosi]OAQ14361.1 tetraacyldisaccharide 4'-kinase [Bibersteinia trehalosi Y31]
MKIWQSFNFFTILLFPFSLLFWLLSQCRKWLYAKHILSSYRAPVPVLIVGNISVGGNGKTPVVIWLVEQLQQHGIKVGVISRGYGGENKIFPQLISATSSPQQMGDEPVLIAQRTGVPVAVAPNRRQSIELLLSQFELDLIIADDGLQHYALQRDIEWVVIDGTRRFGNGFLLPAGGLRELPSRLQDVQAVICNGKNAKAGEHLMQLETHMAVNLKTGEHLALQEFSDKKVVAIAGIGYPPRFFTMLENLGVTLCQRHAFADHQAYDLARLQPLTKSDEILLMTEKDAVKCRHFAQDNWWYVPVSAQFSAESTACLLKPILNLVRKNDE